MSEEMKNDVSVNKYEVFLLAELLYMYFKDRTSLKKITSTKMFYMGENENSEKEYFTSIFVAGFEQYSTHVLFDPSNLLDIKIASVLPNDSYTQDDVVVRQLSEEQAMAICGMIGMDILDNYIKEINTVIEEN